MILIRRYLRGGNSVLSPPPSLAGGSSLSQKCFCRHLLGTAVSEEPGGRGGRPAAWRGRGLLSPRPALRAAVLNEDPCRNQLSEQAGRQRFRMLFSPPGLLVVGLWLGPSVVLSVQCLTRPLSGERPVLLWGISPWIYFFHCRLVMILPCHDLFFSFFSLLS